MKKKVTASLLLLLASLFTVQATYACGSSEDENSSARIKHIASLVF